jgi:two-component system cell cycle response regulator PopA
LRIVVRCQDARLARDTQARLAAAGVEAFAMPGPPRAAPDGQDIIIVPAPDGEAAAALAFARADDALACVIGFPIAQPPAAGLQGIEGFSGAIALDAPPALLAAQMTSLARVAVIEEERARRALTARALNTAQPKAPEPRKLKALYIGAPSPVFLSLERALSEHGGLVAAAFSSFAGFDHLHDEPFDAVVLNGAQDSATAISLCAALRRNASLYHLPTMVITAAGDHATETASIERGASAVVSANAPSREGLGWLFEAIRRERRRRAAEHDVRALRDFMGDTRTGLFRRDAFDAHLARLAADHHMSGRALSLAVLRALPAPGSRESDPKTWKRGFSEIASLAGRLMREADCGAAIGDDIIVVALPAAPLKAARRTAERIASVAECTAFASGEGGVGPLVFEQSSVELQPGESGPGMVARALYALDVQSIPA